MKRSLGSAFALLLLGSCAAPPAVPPPAPPIDWVCLLPEADGHVGRVQLQGATGGEPGLLEGAYNTARVDPQGRLRFVQMDAAVMEQRYGALLRALPRP